MKSTRTSIPSRVHRTRLPYIGKVRTFIQEPSRRSDTSSDVIASDAAGSLARLSRTKRASVNSTTCSNSRLGVYHALHDARNFRRMKDSSTGRTRAHHSRPISVIAFMRQCVIRHIYRAYLNYTYLRSDMAFPLLQTGFFAIAAFMLWLVYRYLFRESSIDHLPGPKETSPLLGQFFPPAISIRVSFPIV